MRKLANALVFVTTIFVCWSAFGAEQRATNKPLAEKTASSASIGQQADNEVSLLKAQNSLIREYQGSLLDTVYWALGGVFGTVLVLAGFGWWSNFKLYEADKERLQRDLSTKISELESMLALRLETNRTELERTVDAKGEAQLSRMATELSDVRANISRLSEESRERSDQIRATSEQLETAIAATNKLVHTTDADFRFVEEFVWETRGAPSNILITQCQGIRAAVKAESSDRVGFVLRRLKDTLSKHYLNTNTPIDTFHRDYVQKVISELDASYSIAAKEVLDIMNKIAVKPVS